MDKLIKDMDELCEMTADERLELYRKRCDDADREEWESQTLEFEEMAKVLRHDIVGSEMEIDDIMFDTKTQALIEELYLVRAEPGYEEISTASVDELLIMLDKAIAIYNNTIS